MLATLRDLYHRRMSLFRHQHWALGHLGMHRFGPTDEKAGVEVLDYEARLYARHCCIPRRRVDFTGKEFNFAPPVSATLDAEYRTPVTNDLSAVFGANMLYNARACSDLGENPDTLLPSHVTADVRFGVTAGYRFGGGNYGPTRK